MDFYPRPRRGPGRRSPDDPLRERRHVGRQLRRPSGDRHSRGKKMAEGRQVPSQGPQAVRGLLPAVRFDVRGLRKLLRGQAGNVEGEDDHGFRYSSRLTAVCACRIVFLFFLLALCHFFNHTHKIDKIAIK